MEKIRNQGHAYLQFGLTAVLRGSVKASTVSEHTIIEDMFPFPFEPLFTYCLSYFRYMFNYFIIFFLYFHQNQGHKNMTVK